jgi:TonB family protein
MWFAVLAGVALKSTLVLAAAWIAAFLLRGQPAAVRHLVWTAAAAAVVALPFLSMSLPGWPVRGARVLFPGAGVIFQTTATARGQAATRETSRQTGVPAQAQPAPSRPDWTLGLMLLWMAGAVALLAQMLVACAAMGRMRRSATPWADRDLAAQLAGGLGILHPVDVLETCAGKMPMTFGILRPAVFMPSDAAGWSDDLRRIVLLHELAHVRRGDVATQMLARLALILNWWNPLAWMAWREFLTERERATDDMVLEAGARASDYASHLLEVARNRQPSPALAWAAVAMSRRSQLEARLTAILDAGVKRKAVGRAWALAASFAAIALVAPLAAVRAQQNPPQVLPADVAATIRAATAQKNHAMLETPAAAFAAGQQYDTARTLLESAVSIREEVSGSQSVDYGAGLLKIADLERKRHQSKEAQLFYTKALAVLGDRPEAVPALMYLGIRQRNPEEAMEYLRKAERLDPAQAGPARMWMALVRERQQKPEEAEELYKSALAVEKPESADAENTLQLYARFLKQQGRDEDAQDFERQAAAARQAVTRPWRAQFLAPQNPSVYRVGGAVKAPALVSKVEPEYSEEARAAKYQGTVVLYVEIGTDGLAHNLHVIKGLGLGLDEKAMEAIDRWRFRPGSKDGNPVQVAATIEVNFKLL